MTYNDLKALIERTITTNGRQEITGERLRDILELIVDVTGTGYHVIGAAHPGDHPGTPDQPSMWLAVEAGTYAEFGGVVVTDLSLVYYDADWHVASINVPFASTIAESIRAAVAAETERAEAAEQQLARGLQDEATNRMYADQDLRQRIEEEDINRASADAHLSGRIDAETARATAAEQANAAAIEQEAQFRATADRTEADARVEADTALGKSIDEEASEREIADTALGGRIDAEAAARQSADETLGQRISTEEAARQAAVEDIEALIPTQANAENQLADKDFVNSSIQTNTAHFIGTFSDLDILKAQTATNNDYAFYDHLDAAGNRQFDRYKYNGTEWLYEYTLNNSSFTAAQWAAINSGTTKELIDAVPTKVTPSGAGNVVTEVTLGANHQMLVTKGVTAATAEALQAEATAREQGDSALGGRIDAEVARATAEEQANATAIQQESAARQGADTAINEGVAAKQDATDNALETTDKTIVGAINEVRTLAQQGGNPTYRLVSNFPSSYKLEPDIYYKIWDITTMMQISIGDTPNDGKLHRFMAEFETNEDSREIRIVGVVWRDGKYPIIRACRRYQLEVVNGLASLREFGPSVLLRGKATETFSLKINNTDTNVTVDNEGNLFYYSVNPITSFKFNNPAAITRIDNINLSHYYLANLFFGFSNAEAIDTSGLELSSSESFTAMFRDCKKVVSIKFNNNIINYLKGSLSQMFQSCHKLASLDVSSFDTANVYNMESMFESCSSLKTLDVSSFNTMNVTNMAHMFSSCMLLSTLDLSGFDTAKVSNMESMFSGCQSLASLDVSNFDMAKVTNTSTMFFKCLALSSVKVTNCSDATIAMLISALNTDSAGGSTSWAQYGEHLYPSAPEE